MKALRSKRQETGAPPKTTRKKRRFAQDDKKRVPAQDDKSAAGHSAEIVPVIRHSSSFIGMASRTSVPHPGRDTI